MQPVPFNEKNGEWAGRKFNQFYSKMLHLYSVLFDASKFY